MGVDLMGRSSVEISINWRGWSTLLGMGEEFGWIPKGTSDPYPMEIWGEPGRYFVPTPERQTHRHEYDSNDGCWVDPDDAVSLAEALTKALMADDYADKPVTKEAFQPEPSEALANLRPPFGCDPKVWKMLVGDGDLRPWVQEFIDFCQDSKGFRIY